MSEANIEIVRRAVDAFAEGGLGALESATHLYATDVEFHEGAHLPEPGTYRGIDRIREYFRGFVDSFEHYSFEIEAILGKESKVVVVNRQRARARGTIAEVEMRNVWVFTVTDGRISLIEAFPNAPEAFAAAGIDK